MAEQILSISLRVLERVKALPEQPWGYPVSLSDSTSVQSSRHDVLNIQLGLCIVWVTN